MDTLNWEATLTRLGLWKAIKGFPALSILIIIAIILLEVFVSPILLLVPGISSSAEQFLIVISGTLLGLIGYSAGDFWDSRFFDPRYGLQGKWIDLHTRPFGVFPAGFDLRKYRDKAITTLFGEGSNGEGIYREAKKLTMKKKAKWEYVEQPLILSKFVRGFIWPFLIISVALIVIAIGSPLFGLSVNLIALLVWGLVFGCLTVLLFIPYFQLRVEHMIRLYEYVAEMK